MPWNGRRRLDDIEVEAVMSSVRADACRDLVADIRTGAANEYLRVKRHKQSELNDRCVSESGSPGGPPSRAQKKKVDNHASAVASRCRQEFLVSEFEILLRRKLSEAQILTAACAQSRVTIAEQQCDLHAKDAEIASMRKQLAAFRSLSLENERKRPRTHPPPLTRASTSSIPHEAGTQLRIPAPRPSVLSSHSRSVLDLVSHFTSTVHSPLAPANRTTASLDSISPPSTVQSSRLAEAMGSMAKAEDLHVFGGTHELQRERHVHGHLGVGRNPALDSQDLGAAMDEIISSTGHSVDASVHPLSDDAGLLSHLSVKLMPRWDGRQRLHPDEVLKANMQSDSTSGVLNPVA